MRQLALRTSWPRVSTWSAFAFLLWTLLMIAILPLPRLGWLLGISLLVSWGSGARPWELLRKGRLWALLVPILVLSSLFLGEPDTSLGPLALSTDGFHAGLAMVARALCIILAFGATIGRLSVSEMMRLFDGLGLRGLGFALGTALNMMVVLGESVSVTYHASRLRGGMRRHVISNSWLCLLAILTGALNHADDVVLAASARAFDPRLAGGEPIPLNSADLAVLLVLAGLGLALMLLPQVAVAV